MMMAPVREVCCLCSCFARAHTQRAARPGNGNGKVFTSYGHDHRTPGPNQRLPVRKPRSSAAAPVASQAAAGAAAPGT